MKNQTSADNQEPQGRFETSSAYEVFDLKTLDLMGVCTVENLVIVPADSKMAEWFTSYDHQFKVLMPYAEAWGTVNHRLNFFDNIYDQNSSALRHVIFGPAIRNDVLGCTRPYSLVVTKRQDLESALHSVQEQHTKDQFLTVPYVMTLNNGLQALTFKLAGQCPTEVFEVSGPHYNIAVSLAVCSELESINLPAPQAVIETINFFEYDRY